MSTTEGDDLAHETLWAPWRLSYVVANKDVPAAACFICDGVAGCNDRDNLVLARTAHSVIVLNRFPYNNGHLLIAPQAHKASFDEFTDDELACVTHTLRRSIRLLGSALSPHGYNVGLNLGRVAGAGLPGHLHWHVVPRWDGDTNFMPIVGDTRVIVQSLDALYDLLRSQLNL